MADTPMSELIIEKFKDQRVFPQDPNGMPVQASEAKPLNTQLLAEMVDEDVVRVTIIPPPPIVFLWYTEDKNNPA